MGFLFAQFMAFFREKFEKVLDRLSFLGYSNFGTDVLHC